MSYHHSCHMCYVHVHRISYRTQNPEYITKNQTFPTPVQPCTPDINHHPLPTPLKHTKNTYIPPNTIHGEKCRDGYREITNSTDQNSPPIVHFHPPWSPSPTDKTAPRHRPTGPRYTTSQQQAARAHRSPSPILKSR